MIKRVFFLTAVTFKDGIPVEEDPATFLYTDDPDIAARMVNAVRAHFPTEGSDWNPTRIRQYMPEALQERAALPAGISEALGEHVSEDTEKDPLGFLDMVNA